MCAFGFPQALAFTGRNPTPDNVASGWNSPGFSAGWLDSATFIFIVTRRGCEFFSRLEQPGAKHLLKRDQLANHQNSVPRRSSFPWTVVRAFRTTGSMFSERNRTAPSANRALAPERCQDDAMPAESHWPLPEQPCPARSPCCLLRRRGRSVNVVIRPTSTGANR
jgi:hypothetical protein